MTPVDEDIARAIKEKYKDRKICIAWPSPEKTDYRFNHDMLQFITQNSVYLNLSVANRVSSRIAVNRNLLVVDARQQGATDIMWIDADTKFPVNGLLRLLGHDKDIVCATTARRTGNDLRAVGTPMDREEVPGRVLHPLKWVGMPFMLTKLTVFDKLDDYFIELSGGRAKKGDMPYFAEPPRWSMPEIDCNVENLVGEDEYFCHHARKAGFDIWCDEEFSYSVGHIGSTIYYISNMQNAPMEKARVDEPL